MFKDVETSVILLYIGAVGIGLYFLYQWLQGANNAPGNLDPTTGQPNGIVNGINASLFPSPNPGGGAVAGSSETYTGAAYEFITSPIQSTCAIFGGSCPNW